MVSSLLAAAQSRSTTMMDDFEQAKSDLEDAKEELEAAQSRYNDATSRYNDAMQRFIQADLSRACRWNQMVSLLLFSYCFSLRLVLSVLFLYRYSNSIIN
jgi:exonuclease VII small subunit